MPKIKLITIDIDGTLYPVKGKPMDPMLIAGFQKAARRLLDKKDGPAVVFCTGKPAAYVEGFCEAYGLVDVNKAKVMSHICEAGSEIFFYNTWEDKRYLRLPDIFSKQDIIDKLRHVETLVMKNIDCTKEEGKSISLSFNPKIGSSEGCGSVEELYEKIRDIITENLGYSLLGMEHADILSDTVKEMIALLRDGGSDDDARRLVVKKGFDFFITHSSTAVDISPFPTGKSLGVAYIASMIHGVDPSQVISIGDSPGDHPAFEVVGTAIAVANSHDKTLSFIRKKGGLVTKRDSIVGVTDVLNYIHDHQDLDSFMKDREVVFK